MFKVLFYIEGKFNFKALFAFSSSIFSGLAAAGIAIIVNEAAGEIIEGRVHLKHLPFFIIDAVILIISRRFALRQGIELVEQILEVFRNRIGNQIRQTELLQMENINKSEIYTKLTINTQIISNASQGLIRVVQSFVDIIIIFIYILHLSKKAGIMFLTVFAAGIIYHRWFQPILAEKIQKSLKKEAELFEKFGHVIDGFKELKINNEKSENFSQNYLKPLDDDAKKIRIELGEMISRYDTLVYIFLFYLSLGCITFLLPDYISLEVKFKIVAVFAFLWAPITDLAILVPEILKAKESLEELTRFEQQLKSKYELSEFVYDPDSEIIDRFDEINIKELCFNYTDKEGKSLFYLGPVNLSLKSGEVIFIVGGNGSGKSTLLKLITGLYTPISGSFMIDNLEFNLSDHSYLFSAVYSDCHIFDGLYGIEEISDEKVNNLLNLMFLNHKISWSDNRFHYSGLSTGQRKRLALILALIEDKQIYVFDEWAAEQDPEFRKFFYEKLLPDMKAEGKTVIAVTHDERYFHAADRIIKMEYGKIIND
ncbi:MAG: ATP-binding cassette domain-containing protein [Desulfobacterales bacterium]|nr:ATP-binding cassette domain-containing protein [Desulfobacterales bacterium]